MAGCALTVAHLPVAIGNVCGLLEGLSMVAHRASGNKIDNIMVVRELIIFCVIKLRYAEHNKIGHIKLEYF